MRVTRRQLRQIIREMSWDPSNHDAGTKRYKRVL